MLIIAKSQMQTPETACLFSYGYFPWRTSIYRMASESL